MLIQTSEMLFHTFSKEDLKFIQLEFLKPNLLIFIAESVFQFKKFWLFEQTEDILDGDTGPGDSMDPAYLRMYSTRVAFCRSVGL